MSGEIRTSDDRPNELRIGTDAVLRFNPMLGARFGEYRGEAMFDLRKQLPGVAAESICCNITPQQARALRDRLSDYLAAVAADLGSGVVSSRDTGPE